MAKKAEQLEDWSVSRLELTKAMKSVRCEQLQLTTESVKSETKQPSSLRELEDSSKKRQRNSRFEITLSFVVEGEEENTA